MPRPIQPSDRDAIGRFLLRRWNTTAIALDGRMIDAAALPGFIAYAAGVSESDRVPADSDIAGLATLLDDAEQSEIVTLDALPPGNGLGSALIECAAQRARALGLSRLLTRTTNDNLDALRFYQRRGFRLYRLTAGAIDLERAADPSIPLIGRHGIPLRDEIALVRPLDGG
ncbi:GNAT family N-acetyltransferase [Pseudomonas sp. CGJS7]|uniref:GNAT family N-acetyltransferase n=1 Tax=Pseudomonas sp. CGJS7 TaxID=3109348 RepID=UPI00300B2C8D